MGKGGGDIFSKFCNLLKRNTNDAHMLNFIQIPKKMNTVVTKFIQIGQTNPFL